MNRKKCFLVQYYTISQIIEEKKVTIQLRSKQPGLEICLKKKKKNSHKEITFTVANFTVKYPPLRFLTLFTDLSFSYIVHQFLKKRVVPWSCGVQTT